MHAALLLTFSLATMCPFCPPTDPTLSERVAQSEAVVLAQWLATTAPTAEQTDAVASTEFRVLNVVKGGDGLPKKGDKLRLPKSIGGQVGDLFLLSGSIEDAAAGLSWESPVALTETAFHYINQAPPPETPTQQRLQYFVKFLEYPDPLIGDDAYAEFAKAPYDDVTAVKENYQPVKLRKWLTDENTLAPRRGLYGLMLGLAGTDEDIKLLETLIADRSDTIRLGIDGVMGGYILLTEGKGLDFIERRILSDPQAPVGDVHAAMTALRFLWQYGTNLIPRDRVKAAARAALVRPEVADLAIADLARWKDWSVQDRLMKMYVAGNPENPLGEISLRRAIIRYMLASSIDRPADSETIPPHVESARKHLETLRADDPRGVAAAERLFRPRK